MKVAECFDQRSYCCRLKETARLQSDKGQALGRTLGAQSIVSGSLSKIDNAYRLNIRVLNVESGRVEVQYRTNIENDNRVKSLLNITRPPKSGGEKFGVGSLNILLGLGSYIEGDILGGISITAGYAIAAGLFIVEATALDWESPAVGVPATIGVAAAGVTLVYGFVRPFIYNSSPRMASALDNTEFKIVHAKDQFVKDSSFALQLSYSIKF